jgi:hypothetical protein
MQMIKLSSVSLLLTLLLGSIISSCKSEGKRKLFNPKRTYPQSLFRNHLLFSDFANDFSFPIWFNDSLIKKNKISKITRIIYPKSLTEASRGDSILSVPSETIEFVFTKNGTVERVNQTFYYDDRKISQYEYQYHDFPNKYGFSSAKVDSKIAVIEKFGIDISRDAEKFALYDQKKQGKDFSSFKNRLSGDFLYSISNKALWGPLEIDKQIRPNPNDIVVLGDLYSPKKIYQVENKVNERNVVKYNYKKGNVRSIRTNEYPFHSIRNFIYDTRGYCTGYIDSTFSENNFLTRTISGFENNMIFSPTKIFHRKENSERKLTLINYEEFIFEYQK